MGVRDRQAEGGPVGRLDRDDRPDAAAGRGRLTRPPCCTCRSEVDPLWIELRLPRAERSAIDELEELYVRGEEGQMVQLGVDWAVRRAVGRPDDLPQEPAAGGLRLRRSGRPAAGRCDHRHAVGPAWPTARAAAGRRRCAPSTSAHGSRPAVAIPGRCPTGYTVDWAGEGEWKITLDVFRDLGLAFGAALVGIFVILMFQTGSRVAAAGDHAGHPADDDRHHARLLAAERAGRSPGRRLPQPGLLHRHGDDRHDRPGRHRGPQLGGADRLHPHGAGAKGCRCARRSSAAWRCAPGRSC